MTTIGLNDMMDRVEKTLEDAGIFAYVGKDYDYRGRVLITVEITMGDWKHDHLRAKWLIAELGGKHESEDVTNDTESDTYGAIHRFSFEGMKDEPYRWEGSK